MGYKLFLDDIRTPNAVYPDTLNTDWEVVTTADEFISILHRLGNPDFVSLDHDLWDADWHPADKLIQAKAKEQNGAWICRWLTNWMEAHGPIPVIKIHSMNDAGAENMLSILNSWFRFQELDIRAERIKFWEK